MAKLTSMPATPGIGYANDWNNKANQIAAAEAPTRSVDYCETNTLTPQSFYYIGGNIGGPIFFPHFNKQPRQAVLLGLATST